MNRFKLICLPWHGFGQYFRTWNRLKMNISNLLPLHNYTGSCLPFHFDTKRAFFLYFKGRSFNFWHDDPWWTWCNLLQTQSSFIHNYSCRLIIFITRSSLYILIFIFSFKTTFLFVHDYVYVLSGFYFKFKDISKVFFSE